MCEYFKIGRSTKRFEFFELIYLFCSYIRVFFQLDAFVRERILHKALFMGNSMRLELTRVCSLNDFQLVMGLYRGLPLFFLECVYLSLLYPFLIFDMFLSLCVCVCVLEWFWISLPVIFLSVRVCVCVCESVCFGDFFVWVCVVSLKFTGNFFFPNSFCRCIYLHTSMYACAYIYIYIYIYYNSLWLSLSHLVG